MSEVVYQLKQFKKILWIDPNNTIGHELQSFQFLFGKQQIQHLKNTTQGISAVELDPHGRYLIMMSSKVFLPEGREFYLFEKFPNVFPKCIIFCGKKGNININQKVIGRVRQIIDDVYRVMTVVQQIESELSKDPIQSKNNYRFIVVSDSKDIESEIKMVVHQQIKKFVWEAIKIEQLTKNQFQETVQSLDPNIVKCIAFSYNGQYTPNQIEDSLGSYQCVANWMILYDQTSPNLPIYDEGLTIQPLGYQKFKDRIQKLLTIGQ